MIIVDDRKELLESSLKRLERIRELEKENKELKAENKELKCKINKFLRLYKKGHSDSLFDYVETLSYEKY